MFLRFNALHENHKQGVLTADRKPRETSDIVDRLLAGIRMNENGPFAFVTATNASRESFVL